MHKPIEAFVIPTQPEIPHSERLRLLARAELQRRDYRILKAVTQLVAGPEWCAWRAQLCEIVNNPDQYNELPPEPPFGVATVRPREAVAALDQASRPPQDRTVPEGEERPQQLPPDPDGIPEAFRGLMMDGESAEKFTERMRRRWQALQHLRIDGTKPTHARALPDMNDEESEELADLEARNKRSKWLD